MQAFFYLQVCLGDEVIVDVENSLMGDSTTMHWHGHHQRGTPYMDGVPYVTQCPIFPGTSFTYRFRAMNAGTHFWHSHTGSQIKIFAKFKNFNNFFCQDFNELMVLLGRL